MTISATASGTEMMIIGMSANRLASSSGRPGMSHATTSSDGRTVTAANSKPGTRCQLARRRVTAGRSASRAVLGSAPPWAGPLPAAPIAPAAPPLPHVPSISGAVIASSPPVYPEPTAAGWGTYAGAVSRSS